MIERELVEIPITAMESIALFGSAAEGHIAPQP